MANPLTGDYDVVLQVSGTTINRLLATMHQNTDEKSELPKFPHSVAMRIGDPTPIDGMRGTAWAQLTVPRIDLIHGKDDRFNLEVGIRARYKPDPGTTPLPEFIHGIVKAQYKIQKIDPNCFGWGKAASDYLWIRVDASTVSFDGTAVDDTSPFIAVQPPDPAQVDARITRLVMYLLKRKFQATPQKVEGRFRRGAMRSLNVGINRSAVAVPLAGQGQLASINQELLDGRDFGVAISSGLIVSTIQQELDALKANYSATYGIRFVANVDLGLFDVDVLTVNVTWRITIGSATVQWSGGTFPMFGTSVGLLTFKVVAHARTADARFNMDCEVTQLVMLTFDGGTEQFVATLVGAPSINPSGLAGAVLSAGDKQKLGEFFKPTLQGEINKFVGNLSVKNRKDELINQLKKLDPTPDAYFDEAVFSPDGVVVRGQILLSGRRAASTEFVKTPEQDGFDAFKSWIPGGRINSFDWTWTWMYSNQPGGSTSHTDRFILRRPGGLHRSPFGMVTDLSRPLPVLDGFGSMCLTVRGERIHSVTGATVPIVVARKCTRAGFDIRIQAIAGGRVFLKEWAVGPRDPIGPVAEMSIIDVGGGRTDRAPNTLVIRAGERWNPEVGATLRDALLNSRRVDAGLQVLLLFKDGTLTSAGQAIEELSHLARDLAAPLMVNEDVRGTWSAALAMDPRDGDVQWRLVTPTGGVSWGHRGAIEVRELAKVFDDYLFPAPPPSVRPLSPGITPGTRITTGMLDAGLYDDIAHHIEAEDPCPPPLGPYSSLAVAVFAQGDSVSSQAIVKRVAREYGEGEGDRPFVVVVVDGARPEDLERLKGSLPEEFVAIPDPQGTIASRLGVRTWPTKVTIKEGVVTAVDIGADPGSTSPDSEAAS